MIVIQDKKYALALVDGAEKLARFFASNTIDMTIDVNWMLISSGVAAAASLIRYWVINLKI